MNHAFQRPINSFFTAYNPQSPPPQETEFKDQFGSIIKLSKIASLYFNFAGTICYTDTTKGNPCNHLCFAELSDGSWNSRLSLDAKQIGFIIRKLGQDKVTSVLQDAQVLAPDLLKQSMDHDAFIRKHFGEYI